MFYNNKVYEFLPLTKYKYSIDEAKEYSFKRSEPSSFI